MEDGFSLKDASIGILGLGLIGGSLAMNLKGKCACLIGFDAHLSTLELALSKGIIHHAESDLVNFLARIDILILAVPVPTIIDFLQQLPPLTAKPLIVTDLGSTKRDILQALSALPQNFDPIGGHPICGKEKSGLENADAELFRNAPFIITPLDRTTQTAKVAFDQIISAVGANRIEMTAEEHDRVLAVTSHLPFLISSALVLSTSQDAVPYIGPGFKSTSRLAGTSSSMMLGVLQSNRENVLNALRGMQHQLAEIEAALFVGDFVKLESLLDVTQAKYQSLTGN